MIKSSWADFFRGKVGKARLDDWLRSNQPSALLKAARFAGRGGAEEPRTGVGGPPLCLKDRNVPLQYNEKGG